MNIILFTHITALNSFDAGFDIEKFNAYTNNSIFSILQPIPLLQK